MQIKQVKEEILQNQTKYLVRQKEMTHMHFLSLLRQEKELLNHQESQEISSHNPPNKIIKFRVCPFITCKFISKGDTTANSTIT